MTQEKLLKIFIIEVINLKEFATLNLTDIIMRDLDVIPTSSRDLDIKRGYQLIWSLHIALKIHYNN